jgi:hypothetical protein
MARDPRLRLPQDVGEIGDRQLSLGQQRDDTQARLFAGGFERAVEVGKRQLDGRRLRSHGVGLVPNDTGYKDIFMPLIMYWQGARNSSRHRPRRRTIQ